MQPEPIPSAPDIEQHLQRCDNSFTPPLSSRVSLASYAQKLHQQARLFSEWHETLLIGLIAAYDDKQSASFFISNVSVDPAFSRHGIASRLLQKCMDAAISCHAQSLSLEVNKHNKAALGFYQAKGFTVSQKTSDTLFMTLKIRTQA